jgi:WD40 repeat protein
VAAVTSLAQLHDGRLAAGCIDDRTRILNVPTVPVAQHCIEEVQSGSHCVATALAVLPEGRLAVGKSSGDITVWTYPGFNQMWTLKGHTDSVNSLVWVASIKRLASASSDSTIRLWKSNFDKHTASVAVLTHHHEPVWALAVLPDGRLISGSYSPKLVSPDSEYAGSIRIWERDTGLFHKELVCAASVPSEGAALAVLADGRVASCGPHDTAVKVWDATHWAAFSRIGGPASGHAAAPALVGAGCDAYITSLCALPDGRLAIAAGRGALCIADVPQLQPQPQPY